MTRNEWDTETTVVGKKGGRRIVAHVREEGSRRHVLQWDAHGRHCSEPDCEVNHVLSGKKHQ